jgi:hypothetical protein
MALTPRLFMNFFPCLYSRLSLVSSLFFVSILFLWNVAFGADDQVTTIRFDAPPKALNPYFLGGNTSFFNRPYDFTNPAVVSLTQKLNLQVIRFPSGSPSNWFDWKTGTFFPEDVLAKRIPADEINKNSTAEQRVTMAQYHPSFKIADMVDFCLKAGATPIWVADLFSGTAEEAADWVTYNKKNGFPSKFWELGNECYLSVYKSRYPNPQTYIEEARKFTAAMKAADPSIQIGIVGTSNRTGPPLSKDKTGSEWVQFKDRSDWNEAIAKEKFYDTVTIHDYFVVNKELLGQSEDEIHRYLMAHCPATIPGFISDNRKLFGNDVHLWITEWNLFPYLDIGAEKDPAKSPSKEDLSRYWLARTIDHALFVADWYLQALRFPENIKTTEIHVLASPGYWGLFQLPAPEKDNLDKPFIENPPFYIVSWLGDALKHSDSYVFGEIDNGPMFKGGLNYGDQEFPGIAAGAFLKGNQVERILLINKTSTPQKVSFAGLGDDSSHLVTLESLTGKSPIEDWGIEKPVKNQDTWRPQFNVSTTQTSAGQITLPADSVSYVSF